MLLMQALQERARRLGPVPAACAGMLVGAAAASVLARRLLLRHRRTQQRFISTVGHELRTPLAALTTAIDVLELAAPGSADARAAQAVLARQARKLGQRMDDLLSEQRCAVSTGSRQSISAYGATTLLRPGPGAGQESTGRREEENEEHEEHEEHEEDEEHEEHEAEDKVLPWDTR